MNQKPNASHGPENSEPDNLDQKDNGKSSEENDLKKWDEFKNLVQKVVNLPESDVEKVKRKVPSNRKSKEK